MNQGKLTTADTDLLVRAEKLRLLFNHLFPAVLVSIFTGILLTAVLWPVQDHTILMLWCFFLMATSALRLVLFLQYRFKNPTLEQMLKWEKPYIFTLLLSSTIWGLGCVQLMPLDSPNHQLIIMYFLMCLTGGAISSYWAHRRLMLAVVAIVITPVTLWIITQNTSSASIIALSFCALTLLSCLVYSSKIMTDAITQNLLKNYELAHEKEKVEYLARKDELTDLYNRRAFYEQLIEIGTYCERHNESLSIIVADIDHFKAINDKYGHFAGDLALMKIGEIFDRHTRTSDICARIGGEEFGILIRTGDTSEALNLAEKLRAAIASHPVEFEGDTFSITASFGVASGAANFSEIVKKADLAMYDAKSQGRNKVILATENKDTTDMANA